MRRATYAKFCDFAVKLNYPHGNVLTARVLLRNGVWNKGVITIDDDDIITLEPVSDSGFTNPLMFDLAEVIALQPVK